MSQQALNATSAVLSLCAFAFFVVGCAGYSGDEANLKNASWIRVDDGGTEVWFGLLKFHVEAAATKLTTNFKDCNNSYCNECERDGRSAISLLIISTVFAFVSTILSGALFAGPQVFLQWGNIVVTFISAAFALIGFGLFMGECYKEIDNSTTLDLEWGPGSILTCLGLLMMWLVVVLQLLALIVGPKAA